jgi:vacuolar-type H+-ATPase subunit E/Vma4
MFIGHAPGMRAQSQNSFPWRRFGAVLLLSIWLALPSVFSTAVAQEIEGDCLDDKIAAIETEVEVLQQQYAEENDLLIDANTLAQDHLNTFKQLSKETPLDYSALKQAAQAANTAQQSAALAKNEMAFYKQQIVNKANDLKTLQLLKETLQNAAKKITEPLQKELEKGFEKLKSLLISCSVTGFYAGGQIALNAGDQEITERLADGGEITNRLADRDDDVFGGVVVGYNFAPFNNRIVVGPFISFDWGDQTIQHDFAGGTFIGSETDWIATAGLKAGVVVAPGAFLYGLVGGSLLDEELNIDFGGPVTSQNETVPGVTVGGGGEWRPSGLRAFGHPVSIFAQYQHTWWEDVALNRPNASPLFNYEFEREDDTVRAGVNLYLQRYKRPL